MTLQNDIEDEVQVYIPQANDPDHRYHGVIGEIVDVFEDVLAEITGNPSNGHLYTVEFDESELDTADFRYDDFQLPDTLNY